MQKENRLEIINEIQKLCNMTSTLHDLTITTGYLNYAEVEQDTGRPVFVPTTEDDKVTAICLTWGSQNLKFGVRQSIDGDNGYGILLDFMKAVKKM